MKHALIGLLVLLCTGVCLADDAFFDLPVRDLQITEGSMPAPTTEPAGEGRFSEQMQAYAVIDAGEAFVAGEEHWAPVAERLSAMRICVRAQPGSAVHGTLYVPRNGTEPMAAVKFTIPADQAKPGAQKSFYEAQLQHYQQLIDARYPGGAWFRFRANEAAKALGKSVDANQNQRPPVNDEVDETYSMFTGGRAVSENLQLDRAIAQAMDTDQVVDVHSIKGIDIAAIDWAPLVKDLHPKTDPLASIIPADQHAIFFPSFEAFRTVLQTADQQGTNILPLVESRSEDAQTQARYQRQLGLDFGALSKLLGPAVVESVAITGSDPYLRVGSDVAIVFETKTPETLRTLLLAKIGTAAALAQAKQSHGDVEGIHFTRFVTDDRAISSYVTMTDIAVIVTNSHAQLASLAKVIAKKSPALSSAPEYTYFRNRYPRGDAEESAFVIVTDATIRRWCGPRWRIADARRTGAAAILADLQARNIDAIESGKPTAMIKPESLPAALGDVTLGSNGVRSSVYGSLEFLTPINELSIDKVTRDEQKAYERWRDQYQEDWRWAFDPIGARITVNDRELAIDLSIMPLIAGSDYDWLINTTSGVELTANAGDPHPDLLHFAMAIDSKADSMRIADDFFETNSKMLPNPLSWIGPAVAIYLDDDPYWAELAKQKPDKVEKFVQDSFARIPVGIYIGSNNAFKLAAFLTAFHVFVDASAPQMTLWEPQRYNGQVYVKISPTEQARQGDQTLQHLAVYYAATNNALMISLNEKVIQRALDRHAASTQPTSQPATQPAEPWLGKSVAMRANREILEIAQRGLWEDYSDMLRQSSWANLPILNEWKRRYPNEDPIRLHERLWATQLSCPAGGSYVWNEKDQTMESTIFGSPTTPKEPEKLPMLLKGFSDFAGGITFENKGLRARARLGREMK